MSLRQRQSKEYKLLILLRLRAFSPVFIVASVLIQNAYAPTTWADPAIKILLDTSQCVGAFDAAYQTAYKMGVYANITDLDKQRQNWKKLLDSVFLFIVANSDTEQVDLIQRSLAQAYQQQYKEVIRSFQENDDAIFQNIENKCNYILNEVRKALTESK